MQALLWDGSCTVVKCVISGAACICACCSRVSTMEVLLTEASFISLSKQLVSSQKDAFSSHLWICCYAGQVTKTFPAWTIVLGVFIGLIFLFWFCFSGLSINPLPPWILIVFAVSACFCLWKTLWCTYGMQCSLLSLCREPETGHTPKHTNYTPQMPCTQQLWPAV